MEFLNTSPYSGLAFLHRDHHGDERWIVVMRVTAKIHPDGSLDPIEPQPPLNFAEVAYGEPIKSPPLAESDLAPFKPKVDVIVNATAYSPKGIPRRNFSVGLKVREPDVLDTFENLWDAPQEDGEKTYRMGAVLHQRQLNVTGPRYWRYFGFIRRTFQRIFGLLRFRLINNNNWKLTRPEPATQVPLRYDFAYGGTVTLTKEDKPDRPPLVQAHPDNPVGCGYVPTARGIKQAFDLGIFSAARLRSSYCRRTKRIKAPQIEIPGKPLKRIDKPYPLAGWGTVPKHWALRLDKAGTFDDQWMEQRHPLLPTDFDPSYWNGAHPDLQFDHVPEDAVIELQNLVPHTRIANQQIRIRLPGIRPEIEYLELATEGPIRQALKMDTIKIDLNEDELVLLYRTSFKADSTVYYIQLHHEAMQ